MYRRRNKALKNKAIKGGRLVVWGILGLLLMAYYLKVDINYGDDAVFVHALDNKSLWAWSLERYSTWTSRNLIEAVMIVLRIWAPDLWRVLNVGMYLAGGYLISSLFTQQTLEGDCVIAGGIMMLFGWDLYDAGYVASSLNYIWPGTCALLALVPVKRVFLSQEPRKTDYLFLLPAVFACNEELTAVLVTGTMAVTILYCIWQNQRITPYLWVGTAIGILNLAYILTCPGNAARTQQEIMTWYPEFAKLGFLEKLRDGFLMTGYAIVRKGNYLFVFLSLIMALTMICDIRKPWRWITAFVLTFLITVLGTLRPMLAAFFPVLETEDYVKKLFTDPSVTAEMEVILFLVILILLFIVLCWCCESLERFLVAAYMLAFGLASKTIMGFSPTVFASGNRTCYFLLLSTIIVTSILADESRKKLPAWLGKGGSALYLLAGFYVFGCQIMAVWLG